jgi:hypothetical protein
MVLTNPTDKTIMFKIKTTVPKRYCVRPNCGILEPKEAAEILISLQPSGFDPNEKNKHKFMIQSLIAPDGEYDQEQVVRCTLATKKKRKCVIKVFFLIFTVEKSITRSIDGLKIALCFRSSS